MADIKFHDLTETFAQQLFIARMGHTGMTWNQLDDEFGKGEYRREVGRIVEGWWNPDKPYVILDLEGNRLWLSSHVLDPDRFDPNQIVSGQEEHGD